MISHRNPSGQSYTISQDITSRRWQLQTGKIIQNFIGHRFSFLENSHQNKGQEKEECSVIFLPGTCPWLIIQGKGHTRSYKVNPGVWSWGQSHSEPHILSGARIGAKVTLTLWLLWLRRWKLQSSNRHWGRHWMIHEWAPGVSIYILLGGPLAPPILISAPPNDALGPPQCCHLAEPV